MKMRIDKLRILEARLEAFEQRERGVGWRGREVVGLCAGRGVYLVRVGGVSNLSGTQEVEKVR